MNAKYLTHYVKWAGLIGAVLTGSVMVITGNTVEGVGIIAAALSSASLFTTTQG